MERKTKASSESFVLLVIAGGILVALNALSALGGYVRKDVTANERYSLSKGSANLLRGMKQEMKADVYVTKGLPKLDTFVRDLRDLMIEYKTQSGGKFDFTLIEAKSEEEKKAAKEAGLVEQPFGEASDTEEKVGVTQGYMGIVLKYGPEKDAIKFLPPDRTDGLEFWITNKIRELSYKGDNIKHKIGVLSGNDEIKLTDANLVPAQAGKATIQQIITQNFPFYEIVDVDLKGGESEIDDALDGLVITQPGKEIPEKALRRIDQFVMKGKSLAVIASAVNVKASDPTMNATLNLWGLDKLLGGYGIEVRKDVVLDAGRAFRVSIMTQAGGLASQKFPQFLDVQDDARFAGTDQQLLDTSFAAFFRMPSMVFPFASSVEIHKEKQPDVKEFRIIARSTPRSVHLTTDTADLQPFQKWPAIRGEWKQYGIAATGEGTFKTAFPEGDKMGIEKPAASVKPSRVLVIASSQFLTNPFARAGNGQDMGGQMGMMGPMGGDEKLLQFASPYAQAALTPTILGFKNMLDWITGDTDLLAVSAKILNEPNLVYGDISKPSFGDDSEEQAKKRDDEARKAKKDQQVRVEIALIGVLPLLFALFGIIRWRMRISARQNLSLA